MLDREKKKSVLGRYNAKTIAIAAVIVVFALVCVFRYVYQVRTISEQKKEISELSAQIEAARQQKEHYENLNRLYQDPDYIKMLAKEKLGLLEKNEVVYKINE